MVRPFSRSKRTPVRLRHKIEKASAAKQRKQRKEAKKVTSQQYSGSAARANADAQSPQWKSRLKKDPGIPNLFPFKDKILAEIAEKKRSRAEGDARSKDATQAHNGEIDEVEGADDLGEAPLRDDGTLVDEMEEDADTSHPMAALLASAQARATEYQEDDSPSEMDKDDEGGEEKSSAWEGISVSLKNPDSSRRAFDKIFKQVVEAADVLLEILDARDPEGTRSKEVERQVMASDNGSKRLIIILNKTDLVPPAALKAWLAHLRRSFPTIPVRASSAASKAQTFDHKQLTVKGTSEALLRALKSYAASKQLKRSISVGVIGYPNVGKSSVINALSSQLNKGKRSFACPTGPEAGVTTSLREIKIDNKLKILDSPGIVFPSTVTNRAGEAARRGDEEARLVLLNALPSKQISDPVTAVAHLLSRLASSPPLYQNLLQTYGIGALAPFRDGDTTTDFLIQVARQRGRIGKGGVPNTNSAAMTVIADWRDGRIQGWVDAPSLKLASNAVVGVEESGSSAGLEHDRIEIVKDWGKEFKLESPLSEEPQDEGAMQMTS